MTFDLTRILESKRAFRRQLASRPIAEKLALLDTLRERELILRQAGPSAVAGFAGALHEKPTPHRTGGTKASRG
jgi:hypothetical protein